MCCQNITKSRIFLVCLLLFSVVSVTACGSQSETAGSSDTPKKAKAGNLQTVIGQEEEVLTELDAKDVQVSKVDKECYNQIRQLIKGAEPYTSQHKKLIQRIKEMTTEQEFEIYGEKTVYISSLPVFSWNCEKGEIVYNNPKLVVFSEDFSKMISCDLFQEDGADLYEVTTMGNLDSHVKTFFKESPDKKFVSIMDRQLEFILDENNNTIGTSRFDINITGDYFQALQDTGIQISFAELTRDKNIMKLDL